MPATALPLRFEASWFNKHAEAQANEAEFAVYDAICEGLDEGWFVVPAHELDELNATGTTGRTELDLLLINEHYGIVIVEVKSYRSVVIRSGKLVRHGAAADEDPLAQVERQRKLLATAIERVLPDERYAWHKIGVALALPKLDADREVDHQRLMAGWRANQFLTPAKLTTGEVGQSIRDVTLDLHQNFTPEEIRAILRGLFPDQDLGFSSRGLGLLRGERAQERVAAETKALESLDQNHRVFVDGSPGSGKSRLVMRWAQRAADRGERVLVTCYHHALADDLASRLKDEPGVTVRPLLPLLLEQAEIPQPPEDPDEMDEVERKAYWDAVEVAVREHLSEVALRFDTVIADEVQDLREWLFPALEQLAGNGRVLAVGDPRQHLSFEPADTDQLVSGWTRATLPTNHRSPVAVGQLLECIEAGSLSEEDCRRADPTRRILCFLDINQEEGEILDREAEIRYRLDQALEDFAERGIPREGIVVLCTSRDDKDWIGPAYHLKDWDHRELGETICETVHKLKGGSYEAVILVTKPSSRSAYLQSTLYSGAGRAESYLTIIGEDPVLGA